MTFDWLKVCSLLVLPIDLNLNYKFISHEQMILLLMLTINMTVKLIIYSWHVTI